MTAIVRAIGLVAVVSAVVCSDALASEGRQGRQSDAWLGACYCRAAGTLECTADLSERECRRRCDEAFCDDWFWKERLSCWNWGYGG